MKAHEDPLPAPRERGMVRVALEAALRSRGLDLRSALYVYDGERELYVLSLATGFSESEVSRVRGSLAFRFGEERGIVGMVASQRSPLYVSDCVGDPRWIGARRRGANRSAYFVPVLYEDELPDVFCVLSAKVDGIPGPERALADLLAELVARLGTVEARVGEKLNAFERDLDRLMLGLRELSRWRSLAGEGPAEELRVGLGALSRREWQILERFGSGQRVTTMARVLHISPHTVRNHLKSICRKLRVQSQGELRERLGEIEAWRRREQTKS